MNPPNPAPTVADLTPPPRDIYARMGELYRELRLLRRLKRIAEESRACRAEPRAHAAPR